MAQGVLTFLFTDIEGSTRRWAEEQTMARVLADHDEVVVQATASHGGRVVKHTGDGVFAVFETAADAIAAAVGMQLGLRDLSVGSEPVRVRMGLHSGTAIERGDDLFGLEVSTAARIMSAAHGGQILASDPVRSLAASVEEVDFVSLGSHRLKDLAEPRPLYQVAAADLDSKFPPLRTLETVQHNLPVQLTSFIGRAEAVEEIVTLVRNHRLVTLTGVGGTGKTRLSLQVAAELADHFTDGVRFVELAAVTEADAVPVAVASVLGLRHERGQRDALAERLIDHLRDRRLLLVFDNCEHLLGSVSRLVSEILSHAPGVNVLASSREGLGLRGERIWQVASLEVGDEPESEAVQLFLDRAQAVAPRLAWNESTRHHIVRICELLDGIPLAIELAAARTRVLAPEQIAARLDDRFRLLTGGSRAALPRQQTLEATVDWSYRLLTEPERRLFERLSVFVGGFTLDAAEAVAAGGGIAAADILDLLTGLVDRSMVLADQNASGVSRYRMLETLRAFGFHRLSDSDQVDVWKDRHLAYFEGWLNAADLFGWNLLEAARPLVAERGNLASAFEWAQSQRSEHVGLLAAALGLDRYLNLGDPEEAFALFETAIDSWPDDGVLRIRALRARLLEVLGRVDDFVAAVSEIEHAADEADDETAVWSLSEVGLVYAYAPELDSSRGIALAERAASLSAELPDRNRFRAYHNLAFAALWGGSSEQIAEAVDRAVEIGHRLDPFAVIRALSTLSIVAMTIDQREGTDRISGVEDELFDLWERSGRIGDPEFVLWAGIRRGWWELVETELTRILPAQLGSMRRWVLMPFAVLRMMQGDLDAADQFFDEFAALGPISRWHHDYYPTRAEIAAWRGDLVASEAWVEEHRALRLDESEEVTRLAGLRALVRAHVEAGDGHGATSVIDEMRRIHAKESTMPAVQLGSPDFYLASAEAELTRLTEPDPAMWRRAEGLSLFVYWRHYCRVRQLEARRQIGEDVAVEVAELRTELVELGAAGLVHLLDPATV